MVLGEKASELGPPALIDGTLTTFKMFSVRDIWSRSARVHRNYNDVGGLWLSEVDGLWPFE